MLFGSTIKQSAQAAEGLNKETEALEGVGAAADEASGALAGFDEINSWQGNPKTAGAALLETTLRRHLTLKNKTQGFLIKF